MRWIVTVVAVAALAVGCGSSKKNATPTTLPTVLPVATTSTQWAERVVNLLLRPLNQDIRIVNGFTQPQILRYIVSQNQTTLRIVRVRLADLARCTDRLTAIGPPPPGHPRLTRVNRELELACTSYVQMAHTLQQATVFLSSGRSDVIPRGRQLLLTLRPTADAAATHFSAALRVAQTVPAFRRAGLQPSA